MTLNFGGRIVFGNLFQRGNHVLPSEIAECLNRN